MEQMERSWKGKRGTKKEALSHSSPVVGRTKQTIFISFMVVLISANRLFSSAFPWQVLPFSRPTYVNRSFVFPAYFLTVFDERGTRKKRKEKERKKVKEIRNSEGGNERRDLGKKKKKKKKKKKRRIVE